MSHKYIRRQVLTKYAIGEKDEDNEDFSFQNALLEISFVYIN